MKSPAILMKSIFTCLVYFLYMECLGGQPFTTAKIDSLVEKTMKTFNVPGIAVAVVHNGKVALAKGYGVRSINTMKRVDEHTLFAIASNSKAFTAAALGILVDDGKLKWDDRVIDFIPEFRLYNPYVTEEFTIRDLLTHRSGMGLGAGDLMIWPDSANFSLADIIHNLRYLKQASGFRTKYDYDNLLYIVAGEVVARASGMSWEDLVEKRILHPLKMTESAACYDRLPDKTNVIDPHVPVNGKLRAVSRSFSDVANSAGGIYSNMTDMCKWIIMQMNNGRYGDSLENRIISAAVQHDMWSPQTIIPVWAKGAYNTHFSSYGLGWRLSDVMGYTQVTHTGGLLGVVTQVIMFPELKTGIIVFTNQQSGEAFTAISNTIKDWYFGITGMDRIKELEDQMNGYVAEALKVTEALWKDIDLQLKSNTAKPDYSLYVGSYQDPWFGKVRISIKNGALWFDSERSPKLSGEMLFYKATTFVVRWRDRTLDADAFIVFSFDRTGRANGFKMTAISPLTDFSYDFQDLDFQLVPGQ